MKNKKPLVEIIILNLNGKEDTVKCLNSLKKISYKNYKITVVDQNSSDGSPEIIKRKFPHVKLIRNKVNTGFTGGNNQVLRKSKAKYCVLLNNDTTQEPSWLSELVKIAESDEKIAALQPKVLSLRNKKLFEHAGAGGSYIDVYGYPIYRGYVVDIAEEDKGQYNDFREVFWCCGVAMFLRMSALKKIGYLDDDFFLYSEEMDLSWRMNLVGYKQVYVPTSVIHHLGEATSGKKQFKFKKVYFLHRNVWITSLKNYSVKNWWKIVPARLFLESSAFLRFLFSEPSRSLAIAKANLWVLFNISLILKKNKEISKLRKVSDEEIQKRMVNKSVLIGYLFGKRKFVDYEGHILDYSKMSYSITS